MSAFVRERGGQWHALWITALLAGLCNAWVACGVWSAAGPAADPGARAGEASTRLLSMRTDPHAAASGPPAREPEQPSSSRAAGRERAAQRLAGEMAAQAQRVELLARRRLAMRSSASQHDVDRRMKESFEEEIRELRARVSRDLREQPGPP